MARIPIASLLTLAVLLGASTAQAQPAIEEVGVMDGALVAGPANGRIVPLVQGGQARKLPVISPNGMRIAFVQAVEKSVALADVVVVAVDGHELTRTHVEPVIDGTAYTGMRYIEELRWLSPTRLVVRGSINPSTSQYYTIDAATGTVVNDFTDDSSHAAFSPDGRHIAVLVASPHFLPETERSPVLLLDGKPIWTPSRGTTLVAAPKFSQDGSALAWVGRDALGSTMMDIRSGSSLHELPLPVSADNELNIFWSGPRVVATASPRDVAGKTRAWSASVDGTNFTAQLPIDPQAAARALRRSLESNANSNGIKDADFWCATCSLAELPRRSQQQ